jgi:hypothetical protein
MPSLNSTMELVEPAKPFQPAQFSYAAAAVELWEALV